MIRSYLLIIFAIFTSTAFSQTIPLCAPAHASNSYSFLSNFAPSTLGANSPCYVVPTWTNGSNEGGDRTAWYAELGFSTLAAGQNFEIVALMRFPNARYSSIEVYDEHQVVASGLYSGPGQPDTGSSVDDIAMWPTAGPMTNNPWYAANKPAGASFGNPGGWIQTFTFGKPGARSYQQPGCKNSGTTPTNLDQYPQFDLTARHVGVVPPALSSTFITPYTTPLPVDNAMNSWTTYTNPSAEDSFSWVNYAGNVGPAIFLPPQLPSYVGPGGTAFPTHNSGTNSNGIIMVRVYDTYQDGQPPDVAFYLRDLTSGCPVNLSTSTYYGPGGVISTGASAQWDENQLNAHQCFSGSVLPQYCDHEWVNRATVPVENSKIDFTSHAEFTFEPNADTYYLVGKLPTFSGITGNHGFLLTRFVPTAFPTWPCSPSTTCSLQSSSSTNGLARYQSISLGSGPTTFFSVYDFVPDPGSTSPYAHLLVNVDPLNSSSTSCASNILTFSPAGKTPVSLKFPCSQYVDLASSGVPPALPLSLTMREILPANFQGSPVGVPFRSNIHNSTSATTFNAGNQNGCNFMSSASQPGTSGTLYGPTSAYYFPFSSAHGSLATPLPDPIPEPSCQASFSGQTQAILCPIQPILTCTNTQPAPNVTPSATLAATSTQNGSQLTACLNDGNGNTSGTLPLAPNSLVTINYEATNLPAPVLVAGSIVATCSVGTGQSLACSTPAQSTFQGQWFAPNTSSCGAMWALTVPVSQVAGRGSTFSINMSVNNLTGYDPSLVSAGYTTP